MEEQKPTQSNTPAPVVAKVGGLPAQAGLPAGRQGFTGQPGRGGFSRQGGQGGGRPGMGGRGPRRDNFVRPKQEFNEKVVDMRRVTRVMAGGKRFRFRATLIIGDGKGRVGVGMGKGTDVQQAVGKAKRDAQKHVITVALNKRTIPHEVEAKFSAARVRLKPAKEGNGLVAGGAVRTVLTLCGIKDITAKCLGRTPNKVTNALATIEALKKLKSMKQKLEVRSTKSETNAHVEIPKK